MVSLFMSSTANLESNFSNALRTLDVETKNVKTKIIFILHRLLTTVELLAFVDIFATSIAPKPTHKIDCFTCYHFMTNERKAQNSYNNQQAFILHFSIQN